MINVSVTWNLLYNTVLERKWPFITWSTSNPPLKDSRIECLPKYDCLCPRVLLMWLRACQHLTFPCQNLRFWSSFKISSVKLFHNLSGECLGLLEELKILNATSRFQAYLGFPWTFKKFNNHFHIVVPCADSRLLLKR